MKRSDREDSLPGCRRRGRQFRGKRGRPPPGCGVGGGTWCAAYWPQGSPPLDPALGKGWEVVELTALKLANSDFIIKFQIWYFRAQE